MRGRCKFVPLATVGGNNVEGFREDWGEEANQRGSKLIVRLLA